MFLVVIYRIALVIFQIFTPKIHIIDKKLNI